VIQTGDGAIVTENSRIPGSTSSFRIGQRSNYGDDRVSARPGLSVLQ
jgi:hypothetical protein